MEIKKSIIRLILIQIKAETSTIIRKNGTTPWEPVTTTCQ